MFGFYKHVLIVESPKLCYIIGIGHSLLNATFSVYVGFLPIVLNSDTTLEIMIPKIRFSIMFDYVVYTLPFNDLFNRLTFTAFR